MWSAIPEVLPFLKARSQFQGRHDAPFAVSPKSNPPQAFSPIPPPCLRVTVEKTAYRPGDRFVATISVLNHDSHGQVLVETSSGEAEAVLMENLVVGIRGIEKLDPQWLLTPKISPGSKLRRGERMILELPPTSLVSNILVRRGSSRTYQIRTTLPSVLPPSYRGTAVQYVYYLSVKVNWSPAVPVSESIKGYQYPPVEARNVFNIWTTPDKSGLTTDDLPSAGHYGLGGIVPMSPLDMEIQWRENCEHSGLAWVADNFVGNEDDENGSQLTDSVTLSPTKAENGKRFRVLSSPLVTPRRSLSVGLWRHNEVLSSNHPTSTSLAAMSLENGQRTLENHCCNAIDSSLVNEKRFGFWQRASSSMTASVCSEEGSESFDALLKRSSMVVSENGHGYAVSGRGEDDGFLGSPPSPSVPYARGKSYNIRIDDQILVRFSPRTPQSVYYFGDVVSGTLSFFHEEGARRCLEVSVFLETREQLSPALVHPSRKNAPTINKVQSEYSEVVADILTTNFIFSIPVEGPASFCTPLLSVQWVLRFEFVASPANLDWSMYESALQVEERERGEWLMPILVHAPLPRSKIPGIIKERPWSPERDGWLCSPRAAGGTIESSRTSLRNSSPWTWNGASPGTLADLVSL